MIFLIKKSTNTHYPVSNKKKIFIKSIKNPSKKLSNQSFDVHGLMAIYHMASRNAQEMVNTKTISGLFDIPVEHLAKVLQKLAKNGLVRSQNVPKGGYALSKKLSDISIAEVFTAIEGPIEMTNCHTGDALCEQFSRCNVRNPLLKILDQLHSPSFPTPSFRTFPMVS